MKNLVDQPTWHPTRKVGLGALAGAFVTILVWILGEFGLVIPPEVSGAMVVFLGGLVSYFVREEAR